MSSKMDALMSDSEIIERLRASAQALRAAASDRDDTIRQAHTAGLNYREIAAEVGLSFQRVHQIVSDDTTP